MSEPSVTVGAADCAYLLAHTTFDSGEQAVRIRAALESTQPKPVTSVQIALTEDHTGARVTGAPAGTVDVAWAYMNANPPTVTNYTALAPGAVFMPPAGFPWVDALARDADGNPIGSWAGRIQTTPAPVLTKVVGLNSALAIGAQTAPLMQDAVALGVHAMRAEGYQAADFATIRAAVPTPLKLLPLVSNYGLDWNDSGWQAAALGAAHYADLGVVEVANEADNHWFNWPNNGANRPVDYANMIVRCVNALAGTGVTVLACASSMWQVASPGWFAGMLSVPAFVSAMQAGKIKLTVHPYGPLMAANGEGYDRLRTIKAAAPGVGVWVTEVGAKAFANGQPDVTQVACATRYLADLKADPQLEAVFWYTHREWGPYNPNTDDGWALVGPLTASGVYNGQNSPASERRPAWAAFQAGAKALTG